MGLERLLVVRVETSVWRGSDLRLECGALRVYQ